MTQESSYKSAGVDVAKGEALAQWLKATSSDKKNLVEDGIGGFASLLRLPFQGMKDPLLITGTDGVGTKVMLAKEMGQLEGIGQDLVAMIANDIFCTGGRMLFFLDYYATGALDEDQFRTVLSSIRLGLENCGALLVGGETAEMSGLYTGNDFDLAGFGIGLIDKEKVIGAHRVKAGDVLIGLKSSGFHSNGYSLIRKWLKGNEPKQDLLDHLLAPTTIYAKIPDLVDEFPSTIHAAANITGGGVSGNVVRILPEDTKARVALEKFETPKWMINFLAENDATPLAVENTFNLGVGMVLAVDNAEARQIMTACQKVGYDSQIVGEVVPHTGKPTVEVQ